MTASSASVTTSAPSSSFEDNPFVDRLGRFKRGTYRTMLVQTGMSYAHAKELAEQAAEEHKQARAQVKEGVSGENTKPSEIQALLAKSDIPTSKITIDTEVHSVTLSEARGTPIEPFDAYKFMRELQDSGVDGATAAQLAHKTYHERKQATENPFSEVEYCQQLVAQGVSEIDASDIARKTAEARFRDPLERSGIRLRARRKAMRDPVHRDSYEVGEREHLVWKPINPQEIGAYLEAVDQYSVQTKSLGPLAVRILKIMFRLVDYKTGRLDPSIEFLCERVGCARATIIRALKDMRDCGFIRWIRRSVKLDTEGAGPRRKQVSNAYGFLSPASWPEIARETFNRVMRRKKPPVPDDTACRIAEDQAATEAMVGSLPTEAWVDEIFTRQRPASQAGKEETSSELAETLKRLGRAIEKEEQAEQDKQPLEAVLNEDKSPSQKPSNETTKTPQIRTNEREFNSDTLSRYSYLSYSSSPHSKTEHNQAERCTPASAGSPQHYFKSKPDNNPNVATLSTRGYRPEQISTILNHRQKRKQAGLMTLSLKSIADLLIKTKQMKP
ncbi:helix-turn-helix domain-containing protein [Zymomonas mobilis]|uniref:helix-turn-helix domain-containing protein n=1 Tax=Zymomonas mobilis TaxID=542 RepID=UPI0038705FB8